MGAKKKMSIEWDIKRIEETFFSEPPKRKKKYIFFVLAGCLILLGSAFLFLRHYRILLLPYLKKPKLSLLTNKFLKSIKFSSSQGKVKFSQGAIYLPLLYNKPQELILNTKKPVDLENNFLCLHLKFLEHSLPKLKLICVVRDEKYYSNALTPYKKMIAYSSEQENPNSAVILVDFKKTSSLINLSKIDQIRLTFYNLKKNPVSLLIEDIKLKEKEEE